MNIIMPVYDEDFKVALFREILKRAYVPGDELETRANFITIINNSLKENPGNDALKAAYDEMSDSFNAASFEDIEETALYAGEYEGEPLQERIDELSKEAKEREEDEEVEISDDEEDEEEEKMLTPLLHEIKHAEEGEQIILNYEGNEELVFTFDRMFSFENETYVVLSCGKDETYYFRYVQDIMGKEKLNPIDDQNLLRMFEFLSL